MGEGTFVKPIIQAPDSWQSMNEGRATTSSQVDSSNAREEAVPNTSAKSRWLARSGGLDWILIGTVVGLVLFGLVMVYSSSTKFSTEMNQPVSYFLLRQSMWALISTVIAVGLAIIDYHIFKRLSILLMLVTIIMLIAVALFGDRTYGAIRSLIEGSIRPSELAKLVIIIYISVWLNSKREVLNDMSLGLFPLIAILGLTSGLILIQPDISAAITVFVLGGTLFFLCGGEWRQIVLVLVVTALLGWIVVNLYPTGIDRITGHLIGLYDPNQAKYHVKLALEAIVNGGLFGVGIGRGSTKFTGLPVPLTDSIFAVIIEELGLVGAGLTILAYLIILWRGLSIAKQAKDHLGAIMAGGITIWIALEAILNMGVMVNMLPHAGNALPLISYGGTNLLVTLAGIGIVINISRVSNQKSKQGGNPFGAVVDLRWRDRRRRVSRPGRLAGFR